MTQQIIDDVVNGRLVLPPVPRVVIALSALLRDPAADIDAVVDEIEQDPVIAGRTLQLANSPFYANGRTLASITDAVVLLGTGALQRMVLTAGLSSVFREVPGVDLRRFWQDATVVATLARAIAGLSPRTRENADAAYLAGLMHTGGHLILCSAYPDVAARSFRSVDYRSGAALAALELVAFGACHTEIGAAWVLQLDFPKEVEAAIRHYLRPMQDRVDPLTGMLALAAQLGAAVARKEPVADALAAVDADLLIRLELPPGTFRISMGQRYDSLLQMGGLF